MFPFCRNSEAICFIIFAESVLQKKVSHKFIEEAFHVILNNAIYVCKKVPHSAIFQIITDVSLYRRSSFKCLLVGIEIIVS